MLIVLIIFQEWKKSVEAKEAASQKLWLRSTPWYIHLRLQRYHYENPHKRVDLCDNRLDFDWDGLPALKHALGAVLAN